MKKNRRKFTKIVISSLAFFYLPIISFKDNYLKFIKRNYKNKVWILSSKD